MDNDGGCGCLVGLLVSIALIGGCSAYYTFIHSDGSGTLGEWVVGCLVIIGLLVFFGILRRLGGGTDRTTRVRKNGSESDAFQQPAKGFQATNWEEHTAISMNMVTVLVRLREAFPDQYIAVDEPVPPQAVGLRGPSSIDHRFHWNRRGATIYVRRGSPDITRIRRNALVQDYFPNSGQLLAYAQNEDNSVVHHVTRGRDEFQFGPQHVEDLIRILST